MASSDRVVAEEVGKTVPVVGARRYELAWTFFGGASVGLVVWVTAFLLQRFVFSNLLCSGAVSGCSQGVTYAGLVAMIIGSIAGLVMLTSTQVYRPLLVVIASAVSLWGFGAFLGDMAWYWAVLVSMAIFGLAYAAFAWFARIRNFLTTLIVMAILVVLIRFVIAS